jgi:uncharacterized NAD(P)/FAD-binding protein YdhS
MPRDSRVDTITSRADFVRFVRDLCTEIESSAENWENSDLRSYLEAMAAWTEDMDGYYRNSGQSLPQQPSWKILAEILLAARVYE